MIRLNHPPFLWFNKSSGRRTRDSYGTERGEDTVAAIFPRKGLRPFPWKEKDSPVADMLLCSCLMISPLFYYPTTILTNFPGTAMTFRICLSAIACSTVSSARASSSICSRVASAGITSFVLSFPFT